MTTMNHEWNVGQVGILHGEKGLPMQEQHRDHEEHHLVFLLRYIQHKHICAHSYLCRIGSPGIKVRLFSGRPKFHHSYLEYYHDLFALKVERGDALIFDGSLPHGQGAIEDEDTWSIFVTLHDPGTFTEGFPNASVNQSVSIYRALTTEDHGWDENSLQHFYDYPLLLQQVCFRHRFMIT